MPMQMETDSGVDVEMTSAATTIDPSVVQSRIRQSFSLQKSDQAAMMEEEGEQPVFPQLSAAQANGNTVEYRRVRCPAHRYTPLREHWEQILTPLVEYLKLQVGRLAVGTVMESGGMAAEEISLCVGMCIVLFLELQTLREASMVSGTKWGGRVS